MIGEHRILLRIEHLQHRAGRIALVIAGHFVDLIDQEDRIHRLCLFHRLDETARHAAQIRAAMAADLAFILDTAQ